MPNVVIERSDSSAHDFWIGIRGYWRGIEKDIVPFKTDDDANEYYALARAMLLHLYSFDSYFGWFDL